MTDWFARPIIPVKDVEDSLRFYVEKLGFTTAWQFDSDGKTYVAQADRQGCSLILSNHWPDNLGKAVIFVSLNVQPATHESTTAALDALRAEFESKSVAVKDGWWGYRLLVLADPDGNQLLFNYPNEPKP